MQNVRVYCQKQILMTEMVLECPDVQGIMGMYYARFDGEAEEVAIALNEQYLPRFAGDKLPESLVACAVSLADKLRLFGRYFWYRSST